MTITLGGKTINRLGCGAMGTVGDGVRGPAEGQGHASTATCTCPAYAPRSTLTSPRLSDPPCKMRRSTQPDPHRAATKFHGTRDNLRAGLVTPSGGGRSDGDDAHSLASRPDGDKKRRFQECPEQRNRR